MKYPINQTLSSHFMNGCTLIKKASVTYNSSKEDYTHILLKCPKGYLPTEEGKETTFIILEGDDCISWYDAIMCYSDKRHAIKTFDENLKESRKAEYLIKQAAKNSPTR